MTDYQENNLTGFPLFTPIDTDYFRGVDDPGGSPASGNVTGTALKAYMKAYFDTLYWGQSTNMSIAYTTSDFSKTSDTTLADITGLTHTVVTGGVYRLRAILFVISGASGGVKVAISGSATATTINYSCIINLVQISSTLTAIDASFGATAVFNKVTIDGWIDVAAGGTLTIKFAQNVSNGTASTVYPGSWWEVTKLA